RGPRHEEDLPWLRMSAHAPWARVPLPDSVVCGLVAHRESVGAVNRLSHPLRGELATMVPRPLGATGEPHPVWIPRAGKPRPLETGQLARSAYAQASSRRASARAECHAMPGGAS